jgi:hypothetical protein
MTAYLGTNDALLRIDALQNANWYKNQLLMDVVNAIRAINFNIVAERTTALNSIGALPGDAPFAVALDNNQNSTTNVRFPAGIVYVCEAIQPWNGFFQTIISALSFKDRVMEKTMLGNMQAPQTNQNAATPSTMVAFSSQADASQAFANTITNMLDALSSTQGIFNQSRFEQEFNVAWGTPAFSNRKGRFGTPVDTVILYGNYELPRFVIRTVDTAMPNTAHDPQSYRTRLAGSHKDSDEDSQPNNHIVS